MSDSHTGSARPRSEIAILAEQIRLATEFLTKERGYKLEHLRNITGGGDADGNGIIDDEQRLHKNSVMKIKDLRPIYYVFRKRRWVQTDDEDAVSDDGSPGRYEWMWNPQIDTLEKLELLVIEARRLGFAAPRPNRRLGRMRYRSPAPTPAAPQPHSKAQEEAAHAA